MQKEQDITASDVDEYLNAIEQSGVLGRSARKIRLLNHLVRSETLGQGDKLKAYSIGLDIFEKNTDFDPASDSIVRVEIGRLRNAIDRFERSEFATTALVVNIPVGTYRPVLTRRVVGDEEFDVTSETPPVLSKKRTRFSRMPILILAGVILFLGVIALAWALFATPRINRHPIGVLIEAGEPHTEQSAVAVSTVRAALTRTPAISVVGGKVNEDAGFRIIVTPFYQTDGLWMQLELRERQSMGGRIIWAITRYVPRSANITAFVNREFVRELRIQLFAASREQLETYPVDTLSPEALFVLSTWVPGTGTLSNIEWERSRIDLARRALELDPDFGAAHSVLADKMAYLSNVYGPADTEENRREAARHARSALRLSPLDPDVVFNVAQYNWHVGRIDESAALYKRVIELDPNRDVPEFLALVTPYTCKSAPDDVLDQVLAYDAGLSADNPIRWLTLSWIAFLHAAQEDWEMALDADEAAARIYQSPYTFMRRAMILDQLGRPDDAMRLIQNQITSWPEFDHRHYILVTVPRLCSENPDSAVLEARMTDLLRFLP